MSTPCSEDLICKNGDFMRDKHSKCALCRLSPDNEGRNMAHYWSPTPPARKTHRKHPQLEHEKQLVKAMSRMEDLRAKHNRDPKKRKVSRLATKAEKQTEKNIIRATKNSGRSNKDGDHMQAGVITLDTKLQTRRENPVIYIHELEKVRADSDRAGTWMGGLVIRNKFGVGCVVFTEADYAELTLRLLYPSERANERQVEPEVPGTS